jgi:hypothetical protein
LESRRNFFCGEWGAVGEFHAGTDFELPHLEEWVVRPVGGECGLEAAVVIEGEQAVVDEGRELGIFASGDGAGLPFARIEGDFVELEFDAEGAAVLGMLGGESDDREEKE